MLRLSKHFMENWRKRVGNDPTIGIVKMIIQDGIRVQEGRAFGIKKTLSYYWHPDLNIIISIDRFSNTAVSVLSKANMPVHGKKNNKSKKQVLQHEGYVAMTMHG
ncbi:MAG: hypothetical protein L3J69_06015 [Desulfobacula sp.]|nr:hypothetical protein [Desulfobacula sp.]